jgi:hypothetical protein
MTLAYFPTHTHPWGYSYCHKAVRLRLSSLLTLPLHRKKNSGLCSFMFLSLRSKRQTLQPEDCHLWKSLQIGTRYCPVEPEPALRCNSVSNLDENASLCYSLRLDTGNESGQWSDTIPENSNFFEDKLKKFLDYGNLIPYVYKVTCFKKSEKRIQRVKLYLRCKRKLFRKNIQILK